MYSCGPLHMDKQRQDIQLEPTYSSSVPIRDVALRIYQKQWTIGWSGKRGSGMSMLIARHDDDSKGQTYFYALGYIVPDKTNLLVDCGATNHVITDKSKFIDF